MSHSTFEKALTANPEFSGVSGHMVGETGANAANGLGVAGAALPNDDHILSAMTKWGSRSMTYQIRNTLWLEGFNVKTDWVRRQLMRLERADRVHRVWSPYAVQICWSVTPEQSA